jgi:uncharacterized protein YbjQ (UPF0145 family)
MIVGVYLSVDDYKRIHYLFTVAFKQTMQKHHLKTTMILTTTAEIKNHSVTETLGLVSGNMVQSKHVGRDIMALLKTLVGGEINGYTEMLVEARQKAQDRMIDEAREMGANAIVNVRYTTSAIAQACCLINRAHRSSSFC